MTEKELIESIESIIKDELPGWLILKQEDSWYLIDHNDELIIKGTLGEIHKKVEEIWLKNK